MKRYGYKHFAPLAATLATLFLVCGCFPDKEKAAAKERERIQTEVIAANELLHTGQTDTAIARLEKLDQAHPNQLDVLEALGFAYARLPDPLMAALYFDHALELSPHQPDLALFAAQAHAESGQPEKAAEAYRLYLALTPEDAAAWRKLGQLEIQLQRSKPALDAYLQVLRLSPPPPASADVLHLASLYHALGNQPQAIHWYEEQLKQASPREERSAALIGLFDISLRQKQWPRAIELMLELETLDPEALSSGPYAQAYEELSRWHKAQQEALAQAAAKKDAAKEDATETPAPAPEDTAAADTDTTAQKATTGQEQQPEQLAKQPTDAAPAPETGDASDDDATAVADNAAATTTDTNSDATADSASAATAVTGDAVAAATTATILDTTATAETTTTTETVVTAETTAAAETANADTAHADTAIGTDAAADASVEKSGAISRTPDSTDSTDGTETDSPPGTASTDATPTTTDPLPTTADAVAATDANATGASAAEVSTEESEQAANAAELAQRGAEAFAKEEYAEAAELLERAVKLNPTDSKVLDQLSRACFRSGSYPKAERYAALAMYAEPKNLSYRLEYLRAYQRNHPPADLLQQMISAKEDFPGEASVTLALARGYEYIAQRKSLAANIYREYLEQAPESPLAEEIRQKLLEWEM